MFIGIILVLLRFVFYPEAVVPMISLKSCFQKIFKIHKKTPVLESLS